MKLSRLFVLAALFAVLLALPLYLSTSLVNAAIQMLIAALFASAFNVLAGQGGMLSFGHAAYFAIGTFATIHGMNALDETGLLPTPFMPLLGALAGCLLGLVAGWFSTQRSGVYFSMITLALAELLHTLAPHLKDIFGGEGGVSAMRMPAWGFNFGTSIEVYYLTLAWVALGIALLYYFTRTPLGRLCLGLRENSHRLKFMGYNVHRLRTLVFTVSATFSGLAGALLAMNNEAANYVLFDMTLSTQVVLNSYIGGIGAFFGPALGAAVMTFFGYAVSDMTRTWLLYQGVIFVLVMMFLPAGLFSIGKWWSSNRGRFSTARLSGVLSGWVIGCAVAAAGFVFLCEFLALILALDYQSQLTAGAAWPGVTLFHRVWLPGALTTWLLPVVLMVAGVAIVLYVNRKWRSLCEGDAE
ncbi:branched-chain amino acid ABC transporter permease [Pollutimonas harenae]|uniref:Branched-chain amino acid ABC transporter permease n=1 Tax=Pollutimonas harenae TaxID=657015 RepID=A0A853GNV9_9BURK|nr:branched-chain amino acid ABC transporter permease [Pollutimonas harenae]NYT84708.1 branched-chain amino acid ABC transporter permease [Pollutimonas harenae]TEA72890.1 branched-chain amino acid ABC transporter permease [Pollutimonas harenae]